MIIELKRGTFSDLIQIDEKKLNPKILSLLINGEWIKIAYSFDRGNLIFTSARLILILNRGHKKFIVCEMPYSKVQAVSTKTFDNRHNIQIFSVSFILSCEYMVRLMFESEKKMFALLEAVW